jgi:hypothetical protein
VHRPAENVEDVLAMADEQGDQQRRSPVIQVRCPNDRVPSCDFKDAGYELQQGRFVVRDSL